MKSSSNPAQSVVSRSPASIRDFKRLQASYPMVFRPLIKVAGRSPNYMPGTLRDISLGGCRFSTSYEMAPAIRIKLRLNPFGILSADGIIPADQAAECLDLVATAEVRWRESTQAGEYSYGVKFVRFHQGDLATLATVIDRTGS